MTEDIKLILLIVFFAGFVWGLFTHWMVVKGRQLECDEHESESVG